MAPATGVKYWPMADVTDSLRKERQAAAKRILAVRAQRLEDYSLLAKLVAQVAVQECEAILNEYDLPTVHTVTYRVKSVTSINKNAYAGVYDEDPEAYLDDLAGARVTLYFSRHKNLITEERARIIALFGPENCFFEDYAGEDYVSSHFKVIVGAGSPFYELLLPVHKDRLLGLRCELQIRTVLQHAFAEGQHGLVYKFKRTTNEDVPVEAMSKIKTALSALSPVDSTLSEVFDELSNAYKAVPPIRGERTMWKQQSFEPGLVPYRRGDVQYPYDILDVGMPGRPDPQVVVESDLYSVDTAMGLAGAGADFKARMWEQLSQVDPAWLLTITHDTNVPRVMGWDEATRTLRLQFAQYSDQVVTNHKVPLKLNAPGSDRIVKSFAFDAEGRLLPFERSPMSNTLGTSLVLRVGDVWVLAKRGKAVAFDANTLGTPASGAVEWTELGNWNKRDFRGWLAGAMVRELWEEAGVVAGPDELVYLGFGREFGRAGKPQLFFLHEVDESFEDFQRRWNVYFGKGQALNTGAGENEVPAEFSSIMSITDEQAETLVGADGAAIAALMEELEARLGLTDDLVVNEELRTNLALALAYRSQNQG